MSADIIDITIPELCRQWFAAWDGMTVFLGEKAPVEEAYSREQEPQLKARLKASKERLEDEETRRWQEMRALEERIIKMPAASVADVLAKAAFAGQFYRCADCPTGEPEEDDTVGKLIVSVGADAERARKRIAAERPDLVALVRRLGAEVAEFNASPGDDPNAEEALARLWREIAAFAPRDIADVLEKSRAAEVYAGQGIGENAEHATSADRALAMMRADLERLLMQGPLAGPDGSDRP